MVLFELESQVEHQAFVAIVVTFSKVDLIDEVGRLEIPVFVECIGA